MEIFLRLVFKCLTERTIQIANFASAFLWAGVLLAPGGYLAKFMPW